MHRGPSPRVCCQSSRGCRGPEAVSMPRTFSSTRLSMSCVLFKQRPKKSVETTTRDLQQHGNHRIRQTNAIPLLGPPYPVKRHPQTSNAIQEGLKMQPLSGKGRKINTSDTIRSLKSSRGRFSIVFNNFHKPALSAGIGACPEKNGEVRGLTHSHARATILQI